MSIYISGIRYGSGASVGSGTITFGGPTSFESSVVSSGDGEVVINGVRYSGSSVGSTIISRDGEMIINGVRYPAGTVKIQTVFTLPDGSEVRQTSDKEIVVQVQGGSCDVKTTSGPVHVRCDSRCKVTTISGSVQVHGNCDSATSTSGSIVVSGSVDRASTVSGSVTSSRSR